MTTETAEEAQAAQEQIEEFARLANRVRAAVGALEDAFDALEDSPAAIDEAMPSLVAATTTINDVADNWATDSNLDFDPA